jgi:hypothetical protein
LHKILELNIWVRPFHDIFFNSEKIGVLFIGSPRNSYFVIFTCLCHFIQLHFYQQLFIPKNLCTFILIFIRIVIILRLWTWWRIRASFVSILSIFLLSLFFFIVFVQLCFIANRFCILIFRNHFLNIDLIERCKQLVINILLVGDFIDSRRILRKIPSTQISMLKSRWVQIVIFLRFENKSIDFHLQM